MYVIGQGIPIGTTVSKVDGGQAVAMSVVVTNASTATSNPFSVGTSQVQLKFMA
jgi:hypothetical protein